MIKNFLLVFVMFSFTFANPMQEDALFEPIREVEILWGAYSDGRHPEATCNITALIFTPNGDIFAARDVHQIPELVGKCTLWNATSGHIIYDNFEGKGGWYVPSLTLGPSGEILVAGLQFGISHLSRSTMVRLLNLSSGWTNQWFAGDSLCVRKLALGPDRNTLAIYNENFSTIEVIKNFFGKQDSFCIYASKDGSPSLAFNRSGNFLAVGEGDGNVSVWDIGTKTRVHNFRCESAVRALAFSPNGKFLAYADSNGNIKIWSLEQKLCIHEIEIGEGVVASLAFSLDGTKIAIGLNYSGKILVWNVFLWKYNFC